MKKQITLSHRKDDSIKVGDRVKLIDNSGLSLHERHKDSDNEFYIGCNYTELMGTDKNLRDLTFEVKAIDIDYKVLNAYNYNYYVQDIIVIRNNVQFRTCSKFVKVIDPVDDIIINCNDKLIKLSEVKANANNDVIQGLIDKIKELSNIK